MTKFVLETYETYARMGDEGYGLLAESMNRLELETVIKVYNKSSSNLQDKMANHINYLKRLGKKKSYERLKVIYHAHEVE